MSTNDLDFTAWRVATADLPWGVQRVLKETLLVVAEEKATLVHGADSWNGHPCLINAVANMISLDVNLVNPSSWFPGVVSAFDRLNRDFITAGINKPGRVVSPLAADVLLANFGTLKPVPVEADYKEQAAEILRTVEAMPYHEPSDAEFADMLAAMDNVPPPSEVAVVIDSDVDAAFDAALRNS